MPNEFWTEVRIIASVSFFMALIFAPIVHFYPFKVVYNMENLWATLAAIFLILFTLGCILSGAITFFEWIRLDKFD